MCRHALLAGRGAGRVPPADTPAFDAHGSTVGLSLASPGDMQLIQVDAGRFRLEFGGGLGLEVILLFSRSVAFWRWGGELVAEVSVGVS